jgi:phage/plasmid-like protein (TIGR03299 family)
VVESAPTPTEALELARLRWNVEQMPLVAVGEGGERIGLETHVANVRSDTREPLAVVTSGYKPVQNGTLASIAHDLAMDGDVVRVESAASIQGGRKVWFLLRGESFNVRGSDEVRPYILLANAHDGTQALRAICTSVRVVCRNTLNLALSRSAKGVGYSFRHTSNVGVRVDEIRSALGLYQKSLEFTTKAIETLAARDVNSEQVQAFFTEAYQRDFDAIPANPKTEEEKGKRERAIDAYRAFARRFDRERPVAGATLWNTLNAYTGWVQHERPVRVDAKRRTEARNTYRLIGDDADRTSASFAQALALV